MTKEGGKSTKKSSVPTELTVGEVAERSGISVSAVHFYESKGLIKAWRTGGNQRRYARGVLRRVAVIKAAQRVGIPLEHIKAALDTLPPDRSPTADDWAALSLAWKADLDSRITELVRLRDHLDTLRAAALAEGREEDAAALDAGSYAITALIHLNAKAEAQ